MKKKNSTTLEKPRKTKKQKHTKSVRKKENIKLNYEELNKKLDESLKKMRGLINELYEINNQDNIENDSLVVVEDIYTDMENELDSHSNQNTEEKVVSPSEEEKINDYIDNETNPEELKELMEKLKKMSAINQENINSTEEISSSYIEENSNILEERRKNQSESFEEEIININK